MVNNNVPAILYASSAVIIAICLLVLIWRRGFGVARFKIGNASVEVLSRLEEKMDSTLDAVNHSEEGQPSLVRRVRRVELSVEWQKDVLTLLAQHNDIEIPSYPDLTQV